MNIALLLSVGAGGAVGALLRHGLTSVITRWVGAGSIFPLGILSANVIGALVLGMLIEALATSWNVSQELRAFLVIGCLGGFTTFSAFTLDVVLMFERGNYAMAIGYILASVLLSCLALVAGMWLVRLFA